MGGAGVFLIYAAYKNRNPATLLTDHINGTDTAAPISTFAGTTTQVPTVTTPDGQTFDTAPGGDHGYVNGDPPSSQLVPGYNQQPVAGYRIDGRGRLIAIATEYKSNPNLFIPPVSA